MLIVKSILVVLVLVALAAVGAGQAGLLRGRDPADLGVRDGRLKAPSSTPNSVSSQAALYPENPQRAYADIAPLKLQGTGAQTMARLRRIIEGMDGAEIVKSAPDYLQVRFTTPVMKFIDDAEFWYDPSVQAIQVRSASRLGSKDFGTNRKRIEEIRQALAAR